MGAWGVGVFDDDAALDFLAELADSSRPLQLMSNAFEEAQGAEYIEYDLGQSVLVSAAVIDAIMNGTRHAESLEELDSFVESQKSLEVSPLRKNASAAVRLVLSEGSELRELWSENAADFPAWRTRLESLAGRLDA
jgi:uncharacterized protein DUF4259